MSFNAKNPMTAPKIEKTPPLPLNGARGLFPTPEGWNDINDDGSVEKLGYAKDGIIDVVGTFDRTNDWDQFRIYDKYGKEATDALEAHNGIFRAKAVYEFVEHEREFFFIQGTYHDAYIGRIYVWQYFFTNDDITEKRLTIDMSDEETYPITDEVYASNVSYANISLGDYVLAKHNLETHLADSDIHVNAEDKTNFIIDVGVLENNTDRNNFKIYDKFGNEATNVEYAHTGLYRWRNTNDSLEFSNDYLILQTVQMQNFLGNATVSQFFFTSDGKVWLRKIKFFGKIYDIVPSHYNNAEWSEYDLSQLEEVFAQLRVDIDAHTSNTVVHVTRENKDNWNDKYTKSETDTLIKNTKNSLLDEIEGTSETLHSNIDALETKVDEANSRQDDVIDAHTGNSDIHTTAEEKAKLAAVPTPSRIATLDESGTVPAAQLPSYVDDTVEGYLSSDGMTFYRDSAMTDAVSPESGKIYVDLDKNLTYRWSGSLYTEISKSIALGETSSTAYAGDKGKANADAIKELQTRATNDETNISKNSKDISNLQTSVDTNASNISTNKTNISKNATDISSLKVKDTELENSINENAENISQNVKAITENKEDILINARDIDYLENMKIANTSQGSLITTNDSAETGLAGLKIYGESEQFSTTGKNLLPYPYVTPNTTNNGVAFTKNSDNSVSINGTATGYATFNLCSSNIFENGKQYYIPKCGNASSLYCNYLDADGVNRYAYFSTYDFVWSSEYTFKQIYLQINPNVTLNETVYPIIVEGSTYDGVWEPYTGGEASPNPNYPQEITSVGDSGSVDLKVQGENWLTPYVDEVNTLCGVTLTKVDDYYVLNGTCTQSDNFIKYIPYLEKGVYTLSANNSTTVDSANALVQIYNSLTGKYISCSDSKVNSVCTGTVETCKGWEWRIRIEKGVTYNKFIVKPQLELGTVATEYEPYKPVQFATFETPDGLRSIPNTDIRDEIDAERKVRIQRVGEYRNTGEPMTMATGVQSADNKNIIYWNHCLRGTPAYKPDTTVTVISNYFSFHYSPSKKVYTCMHATHGNSNTSNYLYFSAYVEDLEYGTTYTNTKEAISAWLAKTFSEENPLIVWYPLAEPIESPLTDEEIAAYKALHTYKPNTTIYNSEGADMSVDYAVDPQIYIDRADEFSRVSDNVSYDNSISGLVSDNVQDAIDEVMVKVAGIADLSTDSWENIQKIVRLGLAPKVFSIGDQFIVNKDGKELVWDIIGFDHDTPVDSQYKHSMTLQLHDCYRDFAFDSGEALYYCEEELPAGTYYFTIQNYDAAYGGNKSYYFTLANSVPAGGQVDFRWGWQKQVTECKINTYSGTTSTTVIESVGLTEGTEGTFLGVTDGTYENLNHIHRARYGHNRWTYSGLRDWLNTDAEANTWWKPYHKFDRPHGARTTAGFLSGMDADFLSVISKVKKRTVLNTITDGGGYEDTEEFMFLLSRSEVFGGLENNINEGEPYAYYKNYSDLTSAGLGADTNRIKYLSGVAKYWWLRSASCAYGSIVRIVYPSGAVSDSNASSSYGVAPACTIA